MTAWSSSTKSKLTFQEAFILPTARQNYSDAPHFLIHAHPECDMTRATVREFSSPITAGNPAARDSPPDLPASGPYRLKTPVSLF
jgi:hypothetical protein